METAPATTALTVPLLGTPPDIAATAFVAPTAVLAGTVRVGDRASVWYHTVLRADGDEIHIGPESNIQDGTVVHADPGYPVRLGTRVSVGHNATLHGCHLEDDVLVGMGAVVQNGARVGPWSIVAAGTVVPPDRRVPPNTLVAGPHAAVVRELTDEDKTLIVTATRTYLGLLRLYRTAGGTEPVPLG
ncbi:gamma carbonic anhydrase family protein [Streptomyces sp. AV19]|uniref:gamma carbonic anhydrase family protein n=1 Tax=Streptomyces sp. AV19 TaxID=2793068 RepID=UPI0018FE19A3|nr:gamma carbonic anhydrase family protein [Streptomyces sp. AV19]MBH1935806.1 gamma carbonic anhydrase family protein [Streptomyces sp. AV19]MDG4536108.1 gamma carbonic anhydrase family protein [Streptomyces sp. AV19]